MVCMIFLLSLECLNKCRDVENWLYVNRHSIWLNGKLLPQLPGHSSHENTCSYPLHGVFYMLLLHFRN